MIYFKKVKKKALIKSELLMKVFLFNYWASAKFLRFVIMLSAVDCVSELIPAVWSANFCAHVLTSSVAVLLIEFVNNVPA